MRKHLFLCLLTCSLFWAIPNSSFGQTYAEKLGYPKGKKVVIFHVDDAGMSYESNQGTIQSLDFGIATSCSIMMPCPWAANFIHQAKDHPHWDLGLHLVLTSEWKTYRWEPLAGKSLVPGLHDPDGAFWHTVEQVVQHATPEEVYIELKAQIDRALGLGLKPSHLDSHMGTLFAHDKFLEKYIQVGLEYDIPVMFPGGNNVLLEESLTAPIIKKLKAEGKYTEGMAIPKPELLLKSKALGEQVWKSGLPVLDDLHTISGDWKPEKSATHAELGKSKVEQFKRILHKMEPGLAMIIIHSIEYSDFFKRFSGSGDSRYGDLLAMTDPDLKAFIEQEGIILTTWREVMERRKNLIQK
ncbi:MAG: polysaccharide deacetylase family protein [Algoriphagus sp.]|uniref:polysaccharide deacetylase family protein n=1 Tax=Algoriphagus sp. TaxID=1872435 RepID=UPI00273014DD|nr:polysaccharide deacetylase family protein [Algoriphagus sp.]MDP2043488.1 polysaccharide deacetylase family protein [Algoriphagus sp.]MDP3472464.1 polysaccharide deacetylase family protein [Algoriphagus sp.]